MRWAAEKGRRKRDGRPKRSSDSEKGDGEALNGLNRRTGVRNRRDKCDSENHTAPKCPKRDAHRSEIGSASSENSKARRPPYSTISMGSPITIRKADQLVVGKTSGGGEQSCSTSMDVGGLFVLAKSDSLAVFGAGVTANLLCFSWFERHNRILQRGGFPQVSTYRASARSRFGDGRLRVVRRGADIPVGIAGYKGKFAAFAPEGGSPASLRRGAVGALGGQLDFLRNISTLRKQGVGISLRVNGMGRYSLRVVDFVTGRSGKRGPHGFGHLV